MKKLLGRSYDRRCKGEDSNSGLQTQEEILCLERYSSDVGQTNIQKISIKDEE
jgi:hypothetical protein